MFLLNVVHYFRSKIRNMSLYKKLLFVFMLSVFIPLVLSTYLYVSNTMRFSSSVAKASIETAFEQAYSVLSAQMNDMKRSASQLINDSRIIENFRLPVTSLDIQTQLNIESSISSNIYYIENAQNIQRLALYVSSEYTYLLDNLHYFDIQSLASVPWYINFTKSPVRSIWLSSDDNLQSPSPLIGSSQGDMLSYVVKAVDYNNYGNLETIIKVDFSKSDVEEILQESLVVNGSVSSIMMTDGTVIAAAVKGETGSDILFPDSVYGSLSTSWFNMNYDKTPYYIGMRAFDKSEWVLVTMVPINSIGASSLSDSNTYNFIFMVFIIGTIMFASTMILSNSITHRITKVVDGMKSVKSGELQTIKADKSRDEIGILINEYNYMMDEMKELIKSKYLSGMSLKVAELKALQAQINPHFLYNTLELISSYSYLQDHQTIDKLIGSLSAFYKLSLNQGEDIYQIWQELQLVDAYFTIQNIRYPGSLTILVDVPSSLLQYSIPKITFQPLIENSIIHGIMCKKERSGTIKITATAQEGYYTIRITDDGIGMDAETVSMLNRISTAEGQSVSHYGIQNINYRLRLFYGPEYQLKFTSIPGKGTTVIVLLPML